METLFKRYRSSGVIPYPGFIYICGSTSTGWYKIGYTRQSNTQRRIRSLKAELKRSSNSLVLDFVRSYKTDYPLEDERALHQTFWYKRIEGEWFALTELDLRYIEAAWN